MSNEQIDCEHPATMTARWRCPRSQEAPSKPSRTAFGWLCARCGKTEETGIIEGSLSWAVLAAMPEMHRPTQPGTRRQEVPGGRSMSDLRDRLDELDWDARWDVDISRVAWKRWRSMRKARDILGNRLLPMLGKALLKACCEKTGLYTQCCDGELCSRCTALAALAEQLADRS